MFPAGEYIFALIVDYNILRAAEGLRNGNGMQSTGSFKTHSCSNVFSERLQMTW